MSGGLTRRSALAAAAVTVSSCGGGQDPPAGRGARPGSGVGLLNSVLALEHAAVAAYAALAEQLGPQPRLQAREIAEQEREHVRRLSGLIKEIGGTPVTGRRAADYASQFPRLAGSGDALLLARDVEERLVRAHLEALVKLPAGDLRRSIAAIATSEAEHLAVVDALRGDAAPQAFVTGT
jgi:rubrerythrin